MAHPSAIPTPPCHAKLTAVRMPGTAKGLDGDQHERRELCAQGDVLQLRIAH